MSRDKMLSVVRRYAFRSCERYGNVTSIVKLPESCLPSFLNLDVKFPICKLFSRECHLSSTDKRVTRYFDHLARTYVNNDWTSGSIYGDIFEIDGIHVVLRERREVIDNIQALNDLIADDKELQELSKEELLKYEKEILRINEELIDVIVKKLGRKRYGNVMVEITQGVGGQEAMLFAKDLLVMYVGYLNYLGYKYEVINMDSTEMGGIRAANVLVSDNDAYEKLKYEGGTHRVQRIPVTAKGSQIHTSTASVAILPEPEDIDIQIDEKDLRIEAKNASGAGGQHVNNTMSAIRITHLPTGIFVTNETDRSQRKNKEVALLRLKSILYKKQLESQTTELSSLRKKQMGMGLRNEKIRTYNFPQDRITDHRIPNGTINNLKVFMKGGRPLEELDERLDKEVQQQMLMEIIQSSEG